jgi:DNA-binding CsgD family transcriptional regulator
MSRAARSTLPSRMPPASGPSRTCRRARVLKLDFTPREREIAALLIEGLTSKLIGKRLAISPRTVDVYRARLMRKTGAATTPELVHRLLAG